MNKKRNHAILRRMGILATFVLAAGSLCATSIEVVEPKLESPAHNGGECGIRWKQDGAVPSTGSVRISLRNAASTTEVMPIAESAPNNGGIDWMVPMDLARKKYVVRVKLIGANVRDDSAPFVVSPNLHITNPTPYSSLEETKTYAITWTWQGPVPDSKVKVQYSPINSSNFKTIAENVPAKGPCQWTVPGDIPIGLYALHLTLQNPASDYDTLVQIVLAKPHVPPKVKK
jgi:hypothetical protein